MLKNRVRESCKKAGLASWPRFMKRLPEVLDVTIRDLFTEEGGEK